MTGRNGSTPSSAASSAGAEQSLMELLQPVLAADGLVVEDLRLVPAGKRKVLRILVDRDPYAGEPRPPEQPVEGLSLDEVAEASRAVSDLLDQLAEGKGSSADPMAGITYTLEVSSPGVERPLTRPRHFRRNVGRLVDLQTSGGSTLRCRITAATPDGVTVQTGHGARELSWGEVSTASVQVEFRRTSPGSAGGADALDQEG